jgi:hypothetical protein
MSDDVDCPYCNKPQEICHDDGYGYKEDRVHQQECGDCGKGFAYTTSVHFYYEAKQAPCFNGQPHQMEPVCSTGKNIWPDWKRCKVCDHEVRGEYKPVKVDVEF